jgi:hypothetical protein
VSKCEWCGTDSEEAAKRHEGPHATWCVHFRESQRGGKTQDAGAVGRAMGDALLREWKRLDGK